MGLLSTVLLRKTFLSYKGNSVVIRDVLAGADVTISEDLAKTVGRALRAPMWEWHYYLGLALAGLLLARVALLFVQRDEHVFRRLRRRDQSSGSSGTSRPAAPRKLASAILHVALYGCLLLMVASGLALYFRVSLGLPGNFIRATKEFHEVLTLFFFAYLPAHLVGIIRAELGAEPGIVSRMIHGGASAERR